MGGSLGMAAGEAIITAMRTAVARKTPFIFFVASGGARMQEGILSLMQMPRTTVAVQELRAARLPYIVVLTNPTTGGVTASYAMLGDVHIAEPGALIGFAGQRVIEQTIREKLPEGFQRAEYLQEHGMVDMVVHRHEMRDTLSRIVRILMKAPDREAAVDGARSRRGLSRRHGAQRRHPDAAAVAASQDHRPQPRAHGTASGDAWPSRAPSCRRSSMSRAPMARARPSPISAPCMEAAGLKVHAYTSPHLVRFHERIRVAGELISEADLTALLEECEAANGGEPITFFEITTAAAFLAFSRDPGGLPAAGSGPGRQAGCDQCHRQARSLRSSPPSTTTTSSIWAIRWP